VYSAVEVENVSQTMSCSLIDAELFFQVVSDPTLNKSGVYWSWNSQSNSFENELSQEASDAEKARKLWDLSEKLLSSA
jgi:hypothetical protein